MAFLATACSGGSDSMSESLASVIDVQSVEEEQLPDENNTATEPDTGEAHSESGGNQESQNTGTNPTPDPDSNSGSDKQTSGDKTTGESSNSTDNNTGTENQEKENPDSTGSEKQNQESNSKSGSEYTQLPFIPFTAPAENLPSKPGLYQSAKIPQLGTVVKRISDFSKFAGGQMPHFSAQNDSQLSHTYPRHHAFSKDNTYILGNGGWRWRALWKADGTFVREIQQAGAGEAFWSNTQNDWIYIVDSDDQKSWSKTNVLTDEKQVLHTFPYTINVGRSEGDISDDDTRVAFSSNNNGKVRVTAYDVRTDSYTEKTLNRPYSHLDWLSVSRSGNYVLVAYNVEPRNVELYSWDLNFIRRITNLQHGDIGWDENGDECWFSVGWLEPDLSRTTVGKWRLSDNAYTEVLGGPGRFSNRLDSLSGHLSARSTQDNPGVINISNYDDGGPYTLFSIKTDGSEMIQLFGWDGSEGLDYYDQPHFATNRDGSVGIFKSNWKNTNDATEMYLIYNDTDS